MRPTTNGTSAWKSAAASAKPSSRQRTTRRAWRRPSHAAAAPRRTTRDRHLVAVNAREDRREPAAGRVAEEADRDRPEGAGQEVDQRERDRAHADDAAGGGDRDAQAVGEAAHDEERERVAAHALHQRLEAPVLAEALLDPRAAALAGEAEVELVGEGVGRDRDEDHDRQPEETVAGEKPRGEERRLALDGDAGEEQRVAVLDEQRLHTASAPGREGREGGTARSPLRPRARPRGAVTAWR